MLINILKKTKKPIITLIIFSIMLISIPKQSLAIFGAGDSVIVVGDVSPTGITNYVNHTMIKLKEFVLDKLATLIAKQVLHQITASVINWINSGFEGSPLFLTNPGAFFLDAADQVTGAFLATNGPLSSLCSPFAIDIRLSLALSQTSIANQRYECTLGKIIEAQKNGPTVNINGQIIKQSPGSMNGFLRGDFNQGGWPAFVALTTEPQNNPYGAFLSAQSDLYAQISARQNIIHADLQLGMGFMSWKSCKDIPGGTVDPNDRAQVEEAQSIVGRDPSVTIKNNKDGTQTYQTCETQTPGSVIAGTLQKNLNVPVTELELADDINAIINALVTKMITTMISSGLGSLSGNSGGNVSYTQQIIDEAGSASIDQATIDNLQSDIKPTLERIDAYVLLYSRAVNEIKNVKNSYLQARSCFVQKSYSEYADNKLSEIDLIINSDINPLLATLEKKLADAMVDRKKVEDMSYALSGTGSANKIQEQAQKYSQFVQSGGLDTQAKTDDAQVALNDAQEKARSLNSGAIRFQMECRIMP